MNLGELRNFVDRFSSWSLIYTNVESIELLGNEKEGYRVKVELKQEPINEEELDKLAREELRHIIPTDYGTGYNEALILAYITGYRKAKEL